MRCGQKTLSKRWHGHLFLPRPSRLRKRNGTTKRARKRIDSSLVTATSQFDPHRQQAVSARRKVLPAPGFKPGPKRTS